MGYLLWEQYNIIAITNEIGMGVIPMEKATRQFVDLQGKVNQYIAKKADKVDLVVSGIPVHVKWWKSDEFRMMNYEWAYYKRV